MPLAGLDTSLLQAEHWSFFAHSGLERVRRATAYGRIAPHPDYEWIHAELGSIAGFLYTADDKLSKAPSGPDSAQRELLAILDRVRAARDNSPRRIGVSNRRFDSWWRKHDLEAALSTLDPASPTMTALFAGAKASRDAALARIFQTPVAEASFEDILLVREAINSSPNRAQVLNQAPLDWATHFRQFEYIPSEPQAFADSDKRAFVDHILSLEKSGSLDATLGHLDQRLSIAPHDSRELGAIASYMDVAERQVGRLAARAGDDDAAVDLGQHAATLLRRNVDRIDGSNQVTSDRRAGYKNFPDYGEVGEAIASARMLKATIEPMSGASVAW
jgi:hypothetical protein